jgi:hypothetical protein
MAGRREGRGQRRAIVPFISVMIKPMIRRRIFVAVLAAFVVAAIPAATAAQTSEPTIRADEVGYFGNLLSTRQYDVFVYSRSEPRAGTHVTICVKGVCKKATGHNGSLAWYKASFTTKTIPMWAPITYTATMSNKTGRTRTTVTRQELLCIHNDGTTPESDPSLAA